MAEGLLRHLYGDAFEAYSAGTAPSQVNPYAIRAMAEIGVDISHQRSKHLEEFQGQSFDYVITVCDSAREQCPLFPRAKRSWHWSLPDPSQASGSEEERLAVFRQVREAIRRRIEETFGAEVDSS